MGCFSQLVAIPHIYLLHQSLPSPDCLSVFLMHYYVHYKTLADILSYALSATRPFYGIVASKLAVCILMRLVALSYFSFA